MGMVGVRALRRASGAACLALLALWLAHGSGWRAAGGASAALASRRAFPHRAPVDIAHRLADFSTLPHALSATPGSWRVQEESGTFTTWRYRVEWACGPRCTGEARVEAEARAEVNGAALSHAHSRLHRVALRVRTCIGGELLRWRADCDDVEVAADVESDGADGAVLRERARATCGGAGGDAACARALRDHRARHHAALDGAVV